MADTCRTTETATETARNVIRNLESETLCCVTKYPLSVMKLQLTKSKTVISHGIYRISKNCMEFRGRCGEICLYP